MWRSPVSVLRLRRNGRYKISSMGSIVVYILFSEKLNRYYAGHTNNIIKRLRTHNTGGKKYTTKGIPWVLIEKYSCVSRSEAMQLEKKIKKRGIKRYLEET